MVNQRLVGLLFSARPFQTTRPKSVSLCFFFVTFVSLQFSYRGIRTNFLYPFVLYISVLHFPPSPSTTMTIINKATNN